MSQQIPSLLDAASASDRRDALELPRGTPVPDSDGDEGELGLEVLQAARAGEGWAATAVSDVYGMGMVDARTGVELATVEGTYGWMPAVAAPKVEARRWLQRAIDVGFGPAHLRLVLRFDDVPREEAVRHLRTALAWEALQPALRVVAEERLAGLLDDLGEPLEARLAERFGLDGYALGPDEQG